MWPKREENVDFQNFLLLPLKMLIRDFGHGKGTNLSPKTGPERSEIAVEKIAVLRKMLERHFGPQRGWPTKAYPSIFMISDILEL